MGEGPLIGAATIGITPPIGTPMGGYGAAVGAVGPTA